MHHRHPSQLRPFHGVMGFGTETEFLDSTVFLFSLRKVSDSTSQGKFLDFETISTFLGDYAAEAEASLLFSKRISKIRHTINGEELKVQWELLKTEIASGTATVKSTAITRVGDFHGATNQRFWLVAGAVQKERDSGENLNAEVRGSVYTADKPRLAVLVCPHDYDSRFVGILLGRQLSWLCTIDLPFHLKLSVDSANSHPLEDPVTKQEVLQLYMELLGFISAYYGELTYSFWPRISGMPAEDSFAQGFWDEVRHGGLKLFVSAEATHSQSTATKSLHTLSYSEAVFDTLPDSISRHIRALFDYLDIKNVIRPGDPIIEALLQSGSSLKVVNPPFVRRLLSLPGTDRVLLDIWAADNFSCLNIGKIIEFALESGEGHHELIGCKFLPLVNGAMGTLGLVNECPGSKVFRPCIVKQAADRTLG